MRLLQLITRSDSIGGAQHHLLDLSQALVRQGHEVLVAAGGDGPLHRELRLRGVQSESLPLVRPISPIDDFRAVCELTKLCTRYRPDVVCTHSSKAGWLGRVVARLTGLPSVVTIHGWAFTEGVPRAKRVFYREVERLVCRLADRTITVSEYDKRLAKRFLGLSEDRVVTVHNGVHDVPPSLIARPDSEPVEIVMVARFEEPKNQLELIRAFSHVAPTGAKLNLVGDGPTRVAAEAEAHRLGVANQIIFSGERHDVATIISKAQVFALASKWEALPLTVIEAMRQGLPVVASNVGGIAEMVEHGESGFLVSRGDIDGWASSLRRLIADSALRLLQGRQARARYESGFRFELMLQQTVGVYQEAMKRRGRR